MSDPLAARVLPVPPEGLFLTVESAEGLFLTVESAEGLFLTVESAEDLLLHGKSAGRPGKTGAETGKLWTFAENMI